MTAYGTVEAPIFLKMLRVVGLLAAWLAAISCRGAAGPAGGNQHDGAVLPLEAVLTPVDFDIFAGVNPSPDGNLVAYDVSVPGQSLEFDYPQQTFTFDGYPMWSSLAVYRAHVSDLRSGETTALDSPKGTSWSGSWSPDGRRYAFYSNRSGIAALWIWDSNDGAVRQVPCERIPRIFRNTERPLWTPDGGEILFKAVPEGMTLMDLHRMSPEFVEKERASRPRRTDAASTPRIHRYPDTPASGPAVPAWMDYRYLSDLVAVEVVSGKSRTVARGLRPLSYGIAPDGRHIAALDLTGRKPHTQQLYRSLLVYPIQGGQALPIARELIMYDPAMFTWSPDGSRIAYAAQVHGDAEATAGSRCFVADVASGRVNSVSDGIPGSPRLSRIPPLWSADGTFIWIVDSAMPANSANTSKTRMLWRLSADGASSRAFPIGPGVSVQEVVSVAPSGGYWSPDGGRSLALVSRDDASKEYALCLLDGDSGRIRVLERIAGVIGRFPRGGERDRGRFAFVREDARHPPELWSMDIASGKSKRVSDFGRAFGEASLGETRLVDWLSDDGAKLRGALVLPAGYREGIRYPLVVWVYGGSYGSDKVNAFSFGWSPVFNFQVLASRGFAVLFPDVPLSGNSPVRDVAAAVLPGVSRIVDLGIADPDRLAVMGQSFGGYNTIALITQTNRFKAAVATSSGAADLFEGYSRFDSNGGDGTGYYETGQGAMGGTPWEFPERYRENSPFFHLDRVHTPLLLQRGLDDPISQANGAVFSSLRRLGRPVEFCEYPREGHVLQIPSNVVDFWNRRLEFLAAHLNLQFGNDGSVVFENGRAKPRGD